MIFRCCKRRIKKPIAKAKPVLSNCLTQWGISHNAKHIKYHGHKNISSGKICHGTFAALVQLISTRNFSLLLGKMGVFPEVWAQFKMGVWFCHFPLFQVSPQMKSKNIWNVLLFAQCLQHCFVNAFFRSEKRAWFEEKFSWMTKYGCLYVQTKAADSNRFLSTIINFCTN